MLTLPVPFTAARLELALPFGFLPTPVRVAVVLLALAAVLGLVAGLYRAELRLVRRRVAAVLLGLRLAAVAAVFVVFAAGPVVGRTVREDVPGRVLVAIDRSLSTSVADPDRTPAEKLRLVRTLRLYDGFTSEAQVTEWLEQVQKAGAPEFPPAGTDAGVVRRAMFDAVVKRADALTRLQVAERLLTPDGADLLARLRERHAVEVVGFAQSLDDLPADPDGLRAALAAPAPRAAYTDLKLPLGRPAAGPLLGVVLLTDGRHNWGESPAALAKKLGTAGVSVYPVNVAGRDAPADVAVVSARPLVTTAPRGGTVPVEVAVRVTRWKPGTIDVTLTQPPDPDGKRLPPLTEIIRHDGQDRTYEFTFRPRLDHAGTFALAATAKPEAADRNPENNRRTVRVTAAEDRPRVLLIDGEARWEYQFLHAALARSQDPRFDVSPVVFRQPRIGSPTDDEAKALGLPASKLPAGPDALGAFDCVILGDVSPDQLPPADRDRLERFVADAGGTLVVVAGKRAMPIGFADAPDADPLRKLLPVRNVRPFASEGGFRPSFTGDGNRAWFLRLGDTRAESQRVWDDLPPHHWAAVGEAKDGAEVLAWAPDPAARTAGDAPERRSALVSRQSYGFGRVLSVGLDSTWRWRFRTGDRHLHRFWTQVIQWAAADRLLPAANPGGTIRFGPREPAVPSGRAAEFVLRGAESLRPLPADAPKGVRLVKLPDAPGGPETPAGLVPLEAVAGRPREFVAAFRELPPGRYAAEPQIPDWADHLRGAAGGPPSRAEFEVLPPETEETADLSANLPLLEDIASASGGKVHEAGAAGGLLSELLARPSVREYDTLTPLRRSWWTLAVVVLLLTAEWVVRKWAGLA